MEPYGDGVGWFIGGHFDKHPDEYLADLIALLCGEHKHPGISKAKFLFVDIEDPRNYMLTFEEYLERKVLLIGIGGGPLDEHAVTSDRKEGHSAASLTFEYFGLTHENNPEWSFLVNAIRDADLEGEKSPLSFGNQLKCKSNLLRHKLLKGIIPADKEPEAWEELALWAISALYTPFYEYQTLVWNDDTFDEVEACTRIIETQPPENLRSCSFAVIESEDPVVISRVHAEYTVALSIIQNPRTKQVAILRGDKRVNFDPIARAIRREEQRIRGVRYGVADSALATAERIMRDIWHFWRGKRTNFGNNQGSTHPTEGLGLMNGNHRAQLTPPTMIPLERIIELVERELNRQSPPKTNAGTARAA